MRFEGLAIAAAAILAAPPASAALIVDTGQPSGFSFSAALQSDQWLGAQFTVAQAVTITDIESYMNGNEAPFTIAIREDGGEIPGDALFSTAVSLGPFAFTDWYGAHGLSWSLDPGDYWVTFEVRPGQTFSGGLLHPAPSPLADEAVFLQGAWTPSDELDIGLRITAADPTAPIPEPAAWWLMILGFGALGAALRVRSACLTKAAA